MRFAPSRAARLLLVAAAVATSSSLVGCGDAGSDSDLFRGASATEQGATGVGDDAKSKAGADADEEGDDGKPAAQGITGGSAATGGPSAGASAGAANEPGIAVVLDKSAVQSELQATSTLKMTVTPRNGFKGPLTLAAAGLPAGASATFEPAAPTITGTAPVDVTLKVTSDAPTDGAANIDVSATAGTVTAKAPLALEVKRVLTIVIPPNAAQAGDPFGDTRVIKAGGISSANPITVYFLNNDRVARTIHGNGNSGFVHGNAIAPGSMDRARKLTAATAYSFYLHGENQGATTGRLQIQ